MAFKQEQAQFLMVTHDIPWEMAGSPLLQTLKYLSYLSCNCITANTYDNIIVLISSETEQGTNRLSIEDKMTFLAKGQPATEEWAPKWSLKSYELLKSYNDESGKKVCQLAGNFILS